MNFVVMYMYFVRTLAGLLKSLLTSWLSKDRGESCDLVPKRVMSRQVVEGSMDGALSGQAGFRLYGVKERLACHTSGN